MHAILMEINTQRYYMTWHGHTKFNDLLEA